MVIESRIISLGAVRFLWVGLRGNYRGPRQLPDENGDNMRKRQHGFTLIELMIVIVSSTRDGTVYFSRSRMVRVGSDRTSGS